MKEHREGRRPSLYATNAVAAVARRGDGSDHPDTVLTASIETIDNDRARLLAGVGVLR